MQKQDIQYVLMLVCQLPKSIDTHRKTNSQLPPHINIAYLHNNIDETKITTELSKVKPFTVKLDEVGADATRVSITISRITPINNICTKLTSYIQRKPQNSYTLTLINSPTPWTIYESETIAKKISDSITLPVDININEIWLMKKEKGRKHVWNIAKKIHLTT